VILTYLVLNQSSIKNKMILAVILITALVLPYALILFKKKNIFVPQEKGALRYSMYCKNCNWEWMSNVTGMRAPTQCPNCREKENLEVLGWRKVNPKTRKGEGDLRKYL